MSSTTKVTATTMFALISVSFCFASYESEKQLESRYLNATEKVTLVADPQWSEQNRPCVVTSKPAM